jgi:trans-aconitate methyltransferase
LTVHKALSLLFLEGNSWVENFNYLFCRYSQPRHLEALSFSRCLSEEDVPILDLACGMGHMTWHLSCQQGAGNVLGLDDQFVLLCLAQFVSLEASFICGFVDSRLPIAERVLGAVYCSDAFFCRSDATLVSPQPGRI